jgi:protein-tyrosine phosphatase
MSRYNGIKIICHTLLFLALLPGMQSDAVSAEIQLVSPAYNSVAPDTRKTDNPFVSHNDDLSVPLPVHFSWMVTGTPLPIAYSFYLSADSLIDNTDLCRTGITDTFCDIWNLELNKRYYWLVNGMDGIDNSQLHSFTTAAAWPRMIYVDGTTNVRDIGGLPAMNGTMIRQGLLYRSAEFNQTKEITDKGLEQLKALGIVTEIDLKMNQENPQNVISWLPRYIRPLSDSGDGMSLYLDGLTKTPEVVASVFREMASPQTYPMIIHCRMGADRTGEIVAMLEGILGCSDAQIILDYTWSSLSTFGRRDTASLYWKDFILYLKSFDPEGGTIQKGTWNFLLSIGVTAEELDAIRNIFLCKDENSFQAIRRTLPGKAATITQAGWSLLLTGMESWNRQAFRPLFLTSREDCSVWCRKMVYLQCQVCISNQLATRVSVLRRKHQRTCFVHWK